MQYFSHALRNLTRNRHRTALALGSIIFGVVAMLLAGGFMEWIFWAIRYSTIHSQLGHIQVVRPGYFDYGTADPFAYLLPAESPALAAVTTAPHVELVTPRLAFTGLISHEDATVSFLGEGVDPAKEESLNKAMRITQGSDLSSADNKGIILGAGLAQNLGVAPNDIVTLLSTTSYGGFNAVEARITGLFRTATKAYDDSSLRVPIKLAEELLRVTGAHRWVLLLDDTAHTDRAIEHLKTVISSNADFEFVPWYDLAEFYEKTVTLFTRQMVVVSIIIGLIIVLSISNLLTMSVLERTTEIGTLMAMGFRRGRILGLFLVEGALLGLLGGSLGLIAGYLLAFGISAVGIPMPPPPGMEVGYTAEILVTWPLVIFALVLAIATTLAGSLYPSWKASRLAIVDALRLNT